MEGQNKNENKNKKILLIEDDENIRKMYQMKLEMEGCRVVAVGDGQKILKLIKKENPNLILLDILLPQKDGFEILKEIRQSKNEKIKNIPVIIASNLSHPDDRQEAKNLNVFDYLVKAEVTPQEMADKVNEALGKF